MSEIFIHINGYELDFEESEAEKVILSVTVNEDSEETMLKLATWLEDHSLNINYYNQSI